jgi:PAS domain S-box-containing protein
MPPSNNLPQRSWKFPWHLVLIFSLLSGGIMVLGYFYYQHQVSLFQEEKESNLNVIADLKVNQVSAWRRERMADGWQFFDDHMFAMEVRDWFEGKSPRTQREICTRLMAVKQDQYEGKALFDLEGRERLIIEEVKPELLPVLRAFALEAIRTKKIVFSDLYFIPESTKSHDIKMSLAIPLHYFREYEEVFVGAVVFQINAHKFLFPIIQSWPEPSDSAEFVMVRRSGDEILYLNELRHVGEAHLQLRKSLSEVDDPPVNAALGHEGIFRGRDYRGVPVLAANRIIPNSPWFFSAKVDISEVNAPLHQWGRLLAGLAFAWIAAAGLSLALVWRNQDAKFYLRQYMLESERHALSQRYEFLTKHANDIILIMDQDWKIIEANDRAAAAYGYEPEELIKLYVWDLCLDSSHPPEAQEGIRFESVGVRKDGTVFPIEVSSSLMEMEGSRLYQYIIRDVTKRKEREKTLQESEQQLRFLSSKLLIIQENERQRISKELHDELGHALMILKFQIGSIGSRLSEGKEALRHDCDAVLHYLDTLIENVRRLSWDLSPTVLEQFGLSIAIKNLLQEYGKHYSVQWTLSQVEEINGLFSPLSQINIYRIFQESLTNIARHAQATQVSVGIDRQNNHVAFTIEDNGKGFDPQGVTNGKNQERGVGLAAMQERARLAGGSLRIWSQPGAGTKLTFTIPMDRGE